MPQKASVLVNIIAKNAEESSKTECVLFEDAPPTTKSKRTIEQIFGRYGILDATFAKYSPREGQMQMAKAVEDAITKKSHLVVEGPTGVGKSIGYLAPTIEYIRYKSSSYDRPRAIIATATIALQDQLINNDLPLLRQVIYPDLTFAVAKGVNNFICVKNAENEAKRQTTWSKKDYDAVKEITEIVDSQEGSGDKAALENEPSPQVWQRFSCTSIDCAGKKCSDYGRCFYARAKLKFMLADIVVVNYALLLLHLQLKQRYGRAVVLPSAQIIVCDEAHELADWTRKQLGLSVAQKNLNYLAKRIHRLGKDADSNRAAPTSLTRLANRITETAQLLFDQLYRYYKQNCSGYGSLVLMTQNSAEDWKSATAALKDACSALYDYQLKQESYCESLKGIASKVVKEQVAKIDNLCQRTKEIEKFIVEAMDKPSQNNTVHYLDALGKEDVTLCGKAIEIGGFLNSSMFKSTDTVVLASATLFDGDNCELLEQELQLPAHCQLRVESPFNHLKQSRLVVPPMPSPSSKTRQQFEEQMPRMIEDIVTLMKGRTLCLFTSKKNMQAAGTHLRKYTDIDVLMQYEASTDKLITRFREALRPTVLLGVRSFWQGVDIPGAALSCVIIDKLPFLPPDDPIIVIMDKRKKDSFFSYSVPNAVLLFKQAFGRLIRSERDKGVVAVLDNRILTTVAKRGIKWGYGERFIRSLPAVSIRPSVKEALYELNMLDMGNEKLTNEEKEGVFISIP